MSTPLLFLLMLVLGVDPGKHTGVAAYDPSVRKLVEVYTSTFWDAASRISEWTGVVIIELPDTKHIWHQGAKNKNAILRTGANVGACVREAELLIQYAGMLKIPCVIQKPMGKISSSEFKRITKWEGQTNQHGRDAGMLCFGFNPRAVRKVGDG